MRERILIIDDDVELCSLLLRCLEREGYEVCAAHTGAAGLNRLDEKEAVLVILDVMLPEMSGFAVLSELRKTKSIPVLMLTARDSEKDKVQGLKTGADDYLTKPFSINEFMARVESLIRRFTVLNRENPCKEKSLIFKGGLLINPVERSVSVQEKEIELTNKEFDLLYFLAKNPGQVFTKKQLYTQIWEEDYAFDDGNMMAYISKLRRKIEKKEKETAYIQTIWGVGYRFNKGAVL